MTKDVKVSAIPPDALRLYAITPDGAAMDTQMRARVRQWLEAGVRCIQLREKMLKQSRVLPFGKFLRAITAEYGALFIVNDSPRLAKRLNADGCHLGQEDLDIAEARRLLGAGKLIGLSVHSREQALAAVARGADYLGVGPIFRSPTKDLGRPLLGAPFAGWAATHLPVPIVAIGGIQLGNVAQLVEAGCGNVAVISALCQTNRPTEVVRAFFDILNSADTLPKR